MSSSKKLKKSYSFSLYHSINAALEGVVHALESERNMRLHFAVAFLVLIAGIYFNFNAQEFMILCFAVTFVLITEMLNTAIEHTIDIVKEEYHKSVKIIKDISAGAVFVSAVNASIVGYILFFKHLRSSIGKPFTIIKQSPWHITFIALLFVIGLVLFVKVLRKEKSLLRGGMPSGHSAVAFSLWVVASLLTKSTLVSVIVFLMAILIAKSRIRKGVHTLWQVVVGAIIGSLFALLIFQIFI